MSRQIYAVCLKCLFSLVLLLSLAMQALAQSSSSAAVNGTVQDTTDARIPNATVKLISTTTGLESHTTTSKDGNFTLPIVKPGQYTLQIERDGFDTTQLTGIVLNVGDNKSVVIHMKVGSKNETVTVDGSGLTINTTNGSVSTIVDRTFIANMPLNGRSFQDLILLTPGTVTQSPQNTASQNGGTGEFSVNGQRPESNYYTVDGVGGNVGASPGVAMVGTAGASGSVAAATALGTTQALVSVDALQEFRVQSSTYSAEYGRNPGGQFSFETRSGTNLLHGTAYDYLRNGFFDAEDWFNDYFGISEPALRQNDFGGTLSGPLTVPRIYNGRNRTFFFFSYEGLRLTQPQAATVNYVPNAALRAATPAPLNQVLNAFPLSNGPDVGNGIAEYVGTWSNPSSLDSTGIRLDHAVSDKLRFFFRFGDTPSNSASRGNGNGETPSEHISTAYSTHTYTAGVDATLASHFTNEARLNYSSNEVKNPNLIDDFGENTPANLSQLAGVGSTAHLSFAYSVSGYNISLGQSQQSGIQRQWNIVDTANLSSGHHQLKFGVDFRRLTPTAVLATPFNEYFYSSQASIETNQSTAFAESQSAAYPLYKNFSAFAQDEWRMSQRLTVSLGLRWEVNPPPGVTRGILPYTIQGASPSTWTLAPEGTPLWRTTWANFAPRLGAAYILNDNQAFQTVVRGGAGVFYDTGQQLGSIGFEGPGYTTGTITHPSTAFPLPILEAVPPILNPPVPNYGSVFALASDLQLPYTIQWNASVEQMLNGSQALTISYVGSHAAKLLEENEIVGSTVQNPNANVFLLVKNGLTSDYNALQLQFRRTLSRGLSALGAYTWSHCSDYGSQNYLLAYQRGNCDTDVRSNFSAAFSYDLPNVGNNIFSKSALHHWGIDDRFTARGGFPITLKGNSSIDPVTGQLNYLGLNLVPNQPLYIYGAQCTAAYGNNLSCPGNRAVNPRAFTAPTAGLGDAPRNFVRGFGAVQMDIAVRREFPLYERLSLQFRAETFNVFNHPDFGLVNPNFGQNTFGQATGTLASTLGILNPLYQMGGPRSMQFALKLVF